MGIAYSTQPTTFRLDNSETRTVAQAITQATGSLTSIAGDLSDSTLTFGGGDPVAVGLNVGDVFALTGTAQDTTYTIVGFSGASNRVMEVDPAPGGDFTADTSFTITLSSTTFDEMESGKYAFRVSLTGATAAAYYAVGKDPVATVNSVQLANGAYEYVKAAPGEKIAVYGTDGSFNVAQCSK